MGNLPPDSPLATSVIVLGEIAFGCLFAPVDQRVALSELAGFIRTQLPRALEVGRSTGDMYGSLKARLFEKYARKDGRTKIRLKQLVDPDTSEQLGVDENDLWIAAQAIDRKMVLVSSDRDMLRIKEVAPELDVEDWAVPAPPP
jgi:predicted nucleic acid-binding protein